jgi:protein arginine N-methyltransferase 1
MKCMKKWVLSEPIVDPIDHQDILTNSAKFYDIDLEKVSLSELDFNSEVTLQIEIEGIIHGFVSWFDCFFSHGSKKIVLSTSPYKKQTHWKQTVFYIDSPVTVKKGDQFTVNLNVAKAKENPRELNVRMEFSLNGGATTSQYYRIS